MQDEQSAQTRFALVLALLLAGSVVAAAALLGGAYAHPAPGKDCSHAYDYPMCMRASAPQAAAPPSPAGKYLGGVAAAALMVLAAFAALHATVRSQADIVAPNSAGAGMGPAAPAAPAQDTRSATAPPAAPLSDAARGGAQWGARTPDAIPANAVPPQLVVKRSPPQPVEPPAARPTRGIDMGELGGSRSE